LLPSTVITDPATGQPFWGAKKYRTTASAPFPLQFQSLFFRQPNAGPAANYVNNWGAYLPTASRVDRYSTRIDHVISKRDSLSMRFTIRNDLFPVPRPDNSQGTTAHNQYRRNINAYISETHIFSPSLVNEFQAGFSRDHSDLLGVHSECQDRRTGIRFR